MKNISKKELIEYIKKAIVHGREHGIDRLVIEDENESEGLFYQSHSTGITLEKAKRLINTGSHFTS